MSRRHRKHRRDPHAALPDSRYNGKCSRCLLPVRIDRRNNGNAPPSRCKACGGSIEPCEYFYPSKAAPPINARTQKPAKPPREPKPERIEPEWTPDKASHVNLYFDGACGPTNPGGTATYGWCVIDAWNNGEHILAKGSGVACSGAGATNNVAEYCGLLAGLEWLDRNWNAYGIESVSVFGDSNLVINQMSGEWKCKSERLNKIRVECLEFVNAIKADMRFQWIPAAENKRADKLSRRYAPYKPKELARAR